MNNKEKLALRALARWFEASARSLPWRELRTPYRVWVSEIMLQQTQVVTVIPYFNRWMNSFPTVKDLADAPLDEVFRHWAGLGYYQRARNLHAGAIQIQREGWPQNKEAWLAVPGVGPYTAGAIASIALNQVEPIVDGNVERVLARVYQLSRSAVNHLEERSSARAEALYKERLWELAEQWVVSAHQDQIPPHRFNQALMELGAMLCKPKEPSCERCPLNGVCGAFRDERQTQFPEPKKKAATVQVQETRYLITDPRRQQVLVVRAGAGRWRSGLWDLPDEADLKQLGDIFSRLPSQRSDRPEERIHTKHVVTHHRIERTSRILTSSGRLPVLSREKFGTNLEPRWIPVAREHKQEQPVALGSPAKKVLDLFRQRLG